MAATKSKAKGRGKSMPKGAIKAVNNFRSDQHRSQKSGSARGTLVIDVTNLTKFHDNDWPSPFAVRR